MPYVVSPYIPFPNICWWLRVVDAGAVLFDGFEHFQKMSYRNRYYISGSNGLIQLSIPLVSGRDQRAMMQNIKISYSENWQVQHWRTLVSVYGRTPYFAHYEPGLKRLFDTSFTLLTEFNQASVNWMLEQLRLKVDVRIADAYVDSYPGDVPDFRRDFKPGVERQAIDGASPYYQIFSDRTGFLPNLSMLDLLFSEGPHSLHWLKENRITVEEWVSSSKG